MEILKEIGRKQIQKDQNGKEKSVITESHGRRLKNNLVKKTKSLCKMQTCNI
jgi:hypothetical protein